MKKNRLMVTYKIDFDHFGLKEGIFLTLGWVFEYFVYKELFFSA